MYAVRIIRLASSCNRIYLSPRNILSFSHANSIAKDSFSASYHIKCQYLSNINRSFSTSSSPDDNHNVPKEKNAKKRRRILSSDSSSDEVDRTKSIPKSEEEK